LDAAEKAMPPQAGTAFKAVRGDLKAAQAALAAKETEMRELRETATKVDEKEYNQLKESVAAYEKELAVLNVQATKEFKTKIAQPLEAAEQGLVQLAKKHNISEGDLRAALAEPDPAVRSDKLSTLSENFNRIDTVRFDQLIVETERLAAQKATAISGAAEQFETLKQQQADAQRKAEEAFQADWQKALDTASSKVVGEFSAVFEKTGDEAWDKALENAITNVKSTDLTKLSNEEIAASMYKAGALPLVLSLVSQMFTQNQTLNETLDRLRGSTPSPGDGTPPPLPTETPPVPVDGSFATVVGPKLKNILPG
jgi:hypothetical protein